MAIVAAAEEVRAPVIVQTGPGSLSGSAGTALPALLVALAREATVPVVVHLDHCADVTTMRQCLARGYTSLMVDGSLQAYENNVALTREAVALGRASSVTVEAELVGTVGDEDRATMRPSAFTNPQMAERFVADTDIDLLAIAIGNVHGFYHGQPYLDLELLDELHRRIPRPLILHGASGLPDDVVQSAATRGISKVNFNTEVRTAYVTALDHALIGAMVGRNVIALMEAAMEAVQAVVARKLRPLGVEGVAER